MNKINVQREFGISQETLVSLASATQDRNHSQEIDQLQILGGGDVILSGLMVDPSKGVFNSQLQQRKKEFGSNEKPEIQTKSFCELVWQALDDKIHRILIASAVVSIVLEVIFDQQKRSTSWIQGVAIIIAVVVITLVSATNNYQKELQFKQLNSVADSRKSVTAMRNGKIQIIHQDSLVVGDIVLLNQGMEIPADAYVITSSQLTCDQSAMTGQTDPVKKATYIECQKAKEIVLAHHKINQTSRHQIPSCFVLSGTRVLSGQARVVITVVGQQSVLGKISAVLRQKNQTLTPLQEKLQTMADDIGKFGLVSAIIVFLVLMIRFAVERGRENLFDPKIHILEIIKYFIISITVIVVAIPEGLPLAVTISLAYSVKKMLSDNNLVRKMEACQTMGGANMICSDKTGTLTTNKMTLTKMWLSQVVICSSIQSLQFMKKRYKELFELNCCGNSSALLKPTKKGSSTQIAILEFFQKLNLNYQDYRNQSLIIRKYPFSSARKRMSILVKFGKEPVLLTKGASEMLLESCTHLHNPKTDEVQSISTEDMKKLKNQIQGMASEALRTIVLAYRKDIVQAQIQQSDQLGIFQIEKQNLVLLAILGVRDIPRPEVPDAIKSCHRAGINVRMVTGDNIITAKAIAKQIGILKSSQSIVLEGSKFMEMIGGVVCKNCLCENCDCPRDSKSAQKMGKQVRVDTIKNKDAFNQIVPKLAVLARSRPQDKYALVTGLTEQGHVVAVTGDGTNDAPALKKADVGFAMGIAGTEVARQAASIILLDDNFNSIVKAIMWGRNIYDSIRKFIQFQLTVNVVAVFVTLVGSAVIKQEILSAIQMLWVNLIMDTLASLALATQAPTPELLQRRPYRRDQYIVSRTMAKHIIGQSIYQLIVIFVFAFAGQYFLPEYIDSQSDLAMVNGVNKYMKHKDIKLPQLPLNWMGRFRNNVSSTGNLCSGRFLQYDGITYDYSLKYRGSGVNSRHFTCVFNVFIQMQVMNFFCCRKVNQEFNIFEGLSKNLFFPVILLLIEGLQILIVCFFGQAFQVYTPFGLTIQHWLICIAFSLGTFFVNFLLKLIKVKEAD